MTLSDIARIASVVSSAAVLTSLLFLSRQLRQNTRNQLANIHHGRMAHIQAWNHSIYSNAGVMTAYIRGMNGEAEMTDAERNQYLLSVYAIFMFYQEYFLMHQDGMLDDTRYGHALQSLRSMATFPGVRAAWRTFGKDLLIPGFAGLVDRILIETAPVDRPGYFAGAFKQFAAEERARL